MWCWHRHAHSCCIYWSYPCIIPLLFHCMAGIESFSLLQIPLLVLLQNGAALPWRHHSQVKYPHRNTSLSFVNNLLPPFPQYFILEFSVYGLKCDEVIIGFRELRFSLLFPLFFGLFCLFPLLSSLYRLSLFQPSSPHIFILSLAILLTPPERIKEAAGNFLSGTWCVV